MTARLLVIVLCLAQALACSKLANFPDKSPGDADADTPDDGTDAGDPLEEDDLDAEDASDPEEDGEPCIDEIPRIRRDLRITDDDALSRNPSLAWTGSEYGVAWWDSRDTDYEIYFARISEAGEKIGDDVRITTDGAESAYPSLVWTGSEFGVVWEDDRSVNSEIFFTRIEPDGTKLGSDMRIVDYGDPARFPSLVWTGSEYGVAWEDLRHTNGEIYFARFDASGVKIGADVRITSESSPSVRPSLAWNDSDNEFGICWQDFRALNDEIWFARVDAEGSIIPPENTRITHDSATSERPSLAWTGIEYGVSWYDARDGPSEIYFLRFSAGGTPAGDAIRVTDHSSSKDGPVLVWADGEFGVVWHDNRLNDITKEIHFTWISETGGEVGPIEGMTSETEGSADASLVWTGSEYGVAWWDGRYGNDEISFNIISLCP